MSESFLREKITGNDVLLVQALDSPSRQVLKARVLRTYGVARVVPLMAVGSEFEFVHAPDSWGNTALQVGQSALLFLHIIGGRLYEEPWNGHLVIEEIDGDSYALYRERQLWQRSEVPAVIRAAARAHPHLTHLTGIHLATLEAYLAQLIRQVQDDAPHSP